MTGGQIGSTFPPGITLNSDVPEAWIHNGQLRAAAFRNDPLTADVSRSHDIPHYGASWFPWLSVWGSKRYMLQGLLDLHMIERDN